MSNLTFDPELYELIEEIDLPVEVSKEQIENDLVISSKYMSALGMIDKKKADLDTKKSGVLAWFDKQYNTLARAEEFIRGKLYDTLNSAKEYGKQKPKISNWAGTAYLSTSSGYNWNGLKGDDESLITLAEKYGCAVKIKKSVSLTDVKKILENNEEARKAFAEELGITKETNDTLTVRKA